MKVSFWTKSKFARYRIIVFILLAISYSLKSYGIDPPDNLFNIFFNVNFEQNTPGNYADREFYRDWLNPPWENRQIPPQIVQDPNDPENQAMQWNFPEGSLGPDEGGGSWESPLGHSYDEIYFSYDVMFKPGFEFVLGGKLPGVGGGPKSSGAGVKPAWDEGFTATLAFHPEGKIVFYTYNQNQPGDYGQVIGWNVNVTPGSWHNLTIRVVMNTVDGNGGRNDGILEGFFDGQLVCQQTQMCFRNLTSIGTDLLKIYSFFGGGDDRFRNTRDEWIKLDNFVMFTYSNEVTTVPRGNQPSSHQKKLLHPFIDYDDVAWIPSVTKGSVGSDHIELLWNPYPFPVEYTVERKQTGTSDFTRIGTLSYNSSSFNDINLTPATSYTYRVKAGTRISNEITIATTSIDNLPGAPSGLTAEAIDHNHILLKWTDESSDETGFEIERIGPDNTAIRNLFIINPDNTRYTDIALQMNAAYQYRIRAYNAEGKSPYTSYAQVRTPLLTPPSAPSLLTSTAHSEKSITLSWNDNSDNEKGFILTRKPESDPSQSHSFSLQANVSTYIDSDLAPGTTYLYNLVAVNDAGVSTASNNYVASTLTPPPPPEEKPLREGLIAYYDFSYNPDNIVYDRSKYGVPLNLLVPEPSSILWKNDNQLSLVGNTELVSATPANKIVAAIKKTNEITIECWIIPDEPEDVPTSRIFSLGNNDDEIGVVLDQQYNDAFGEKKLSYVTRMQTASTGAAGYPEYVSDLSLDYIHLQHMAFVHDSLGLETLYINGQKSSEGFRPSSIDTWKDNFYLRLGNEKDLNHPWKGTFCYMSIYDKALSKDEINLNYRALPVDSVTDSYLNFNVNAFPNPVSNEISIEVVPEAYGVLIPETRIGITDAFGNVYLQRKLFNPNINLCETVNVESFPKGAYFVQVRLGKIQKSVKIIVL